MKKLSQIGLKKLFTSQKTTCLKREMCKIGWLLWLRGLIDGNGGNIVVRLASGLYLCTPTMVSKGNLTTADICLVDSTGKQLLGKKIRTSEVLTHLAILNYRPEIMASIHSHPPIATAFANCGKLPKINLTPEAIVFLKPVFVKYCFPGSLELSQAITKAVSGEVNAVLMGNHGLITFAKDLQLAYFLTENFEAASRLWVDSQLVAALTGGKVKKLSGCKLRDLLAIRKKLGL